MFVSSEQSYSDGLSCLYKYSVMSPVPVQRFYWQHLTTLQKIALMSLFRLSRTVENWLPQHPLPIGPHTTLNPALHDSIGRFYKILLLPQMGKGMLLF